MWLLENEEAFEGKREACAKPGVAVIPLSVLTIFTQAADYGCALAKRIFLGGPQRSVSLQLHRALMLEIYTDWGDFSWTACNLT